MIRLRVCVWGLCLGLSCATPCAAQSAWTIGFGPAALLRTGVIVPVSSRVEVEPFVYVPLGAVGGGVSVRTSTRVYVSMLAASHVLYAQPDWHTQGWPTVSVGSLVGIGCEGLGHGAQRLIDLRGWAADDGDAHRVGLQQRRNAG